MVEKGLHSGHRERMIEKFIEAKGNFPDHELLEILLYGYLPRKDTNPIAHKLLRLFGDINGVFSAKVEDLVKVDGIGKKAATGIAITGKLIERLKDAKENKAPVSMSSLENVKKEACPMLKCLKEEKFLLFLLDAKYKKKAFVTYKDENESKVSADIPEIRNALFIHKPKYALMVHNHPSGNLTPSKEDDLATKKMNFLCAVNGVTLLDHVIICGDKAYSYVRENRLDDLVKNFDFDKIIEKL